MTQRPPRLGIWRLGLRALGCLELRAQVGSEVKRPRIERETARAREGTAGAGGKIWREQAGIRWRRCGIAPFRCVEACGEKIVVGQYGGGGREAVGRMGGGGGRTRSPLLQFTRHFGPAAEPACLCDFLWVGGWQRERERERESVTTLNAAHTRRWPAAAQVCVCEGERLKFADEQVSRRVGK